MINEHDLEDWKDIPGWDNYYQASSKGKIRSVKRELEVPHPHSKRLYKRPYGGKILSPKIGDGDYLYVNLWRGNRGHMRAVHRLVCAAFTDQEAPESLVCNHKNGIRDDNRSSNLEFITQKENLYDSAIRHGFRTIGEHVRQFQASWRNSLSKT